MPYNVQVHDVEINTLVVDYYPPHPPPPNKNMQNANKNQEKMTKLVTGH